jgi:hypothetical protein
MKRPASAVLAILESAPDLLDAYASDPIEWGTEGGPSNGITLAPPVDWHEGDPSFIPTYKLEPVAEAPAPPALALVPKRSLIDRLEDTQAIYETLAGLDDADLDGEAREELAAMLTESVSGTKAKIDGSCWVLSQYESSIVLAQAEAARCTKRALSLAKQKENLESYLLMAIRRSGGKKLEGHTSAISMKLNPAKLVIDDEDGIPIQFWRTPEPPPPPHPLPIPDNTAIKLALKLDPAAVPGCRLVQGERLSRS